MKVRNLVEAKHAIAAASSPVLKPRLPGYITREILDIETQESTRLAEVYSQACDVWVRTASVEDASEFLRFGKRMTALQGYLSLCITYWSLEPEFVSDWTSWATRHMNDAYQIFALAVKIEGIDLSVDLTKAVDLESSLDRKRNLN